MKSFRLTLNSAAELIAFAVAMLVSIALLWGLHFFHLERTGIRIAGILTGAGFAGYLGSGMLHRTLRRQYPHARAISLLAMGLLIAVSGFIARLVLQHTDDTVSTLAFIVPAGACIATFVAMNRRDPVVTR